MALRGEGQTLDKKKIAERYAQRFFSPSAGMTLAQRYEWSGTPLKAGQGPAAAHLQAAASAADPLQHSMIR